MNAKLFFLIGLAFLAVQCKNKEKQQSAEPAEEQNWVWLFDGSSTDQWRDTKTDQFPEHGWKVEGDVLTVLGETEDQAGGHDIITKQLYSNFELECEARLTKGANSGVKYVVSDSYSGREGQFYGLEYQLFDYEPESIEQDRRGTYKFGGVYDIMSPPENIQINPPGEWNKVRIKVDGNHVEHWLNDEKILEYNRKSACFRELVSLSKFKERQNFGELDSGHILLQGHGDSVSFRNIRIRTL